jgi:hypothetical protein
MYDEGDEKITLAGGYPCSTERSLALRAHDQQTIEYRLGLMASGRLVDIHRPLHCALSE